MDSVGRTVHRADRTYASAPGAAKRRHNAAHGASRGWASAKGGKKDRKAGLTSETSQISFLKFLCRLDPKTIKALVSSTENIRLTDFEVESLRNIRWFQFMCDRCGSDENYPDVFHLWTAERNGLRAFLTLDSVFFELVSRVRNEKKKSIEIRTEVVRPRDLMNRLGIEHLDPVQLG